VNILPAGALKTIHVQRQNLLDGVPGVFIIRTEGRRTQFSDQINIEGPSRFVYRPELAPGSRVVLETRAEVVYE
jgi:hypothetical protein